MGESVAVIGTGRIGMPLLRRLAGSGLQTIGHDRRAECAAEVEAAGGTWAANAMDAVAPAKIVLTSLPGSPELSDLMLGDGAQPGLLASWPSDAIWVDHTSASPELGRRLATAAAQAGVGYLDAPIGGGVPAMRDGTVTLYVGGHDATLAAVRTTLETFAPTEAIHHVGDHGSGYLCKLLINMLWFGQAALVAEALTLARSGGLDLDTMQHALVGSAADSAFVQKHLPFLLRGDYLTDFGLDRCVEELESVERAADAAKLPFAVSRAVTELHREALREFGAVDGELMAAALIERRSGIELRGTPSP